MNYTLPVLIENQWASDVWRARIEDVVDIECDAFASAHAIDRVLAAGLIRDGYQQIFLSTVWPAGNA
jgi:hypothetical protein